MFFNFQCIMMLVSFLVSLRLLKKSSLFHLKYFPLYTTVGIVVMIPMLLFIYTNLKIINLEFTFSFADLINNYSLIFNFSFLGVFLIINMPDKKSYFILWILFFLFLIGIISSILFSAKNNPNNIAFAVNHFGLIIFSIIFFKKLFYNLPEKNIFNYSTFWIVTGIVFCSVVSFPLFYFVDFLIKSSMYNEDNRLFFNIRPFSYGVMHIFFSKAFKCSA